MSSFIEIRPQSTEISRHAKQVLKNGQTTDGRTDGWTERWPENITLFAYGGGITTTSWWW